MVADPLLCELGRLYNEGQYVAVERQAAPLVADLVVEPLKARAESLVFLAKVCELWDCFSWKQAFALLREFPKQERNTGCLKKI